MLQRIFKRANRRGFTVREYDLEALAENAQYDLFHNSCSTDHCLNHLYTANRKPAGSMQAHREGGVAGASARGPGVPLKKILSWCEREVKASQQKWGG